MTIKDRIRVPPKRLGGDILEAAKEEIEEKYRAMVVSNETMIICVLGIREVGEGIIIPNDGAVYYETVFDVLAFEAKPHELFVGNVSNIAEFGAFVSLGPVEGLIHLSQVMDDYVVYSKSGSLMGKETKKSLKIGDEVFARVVAVSLGLEKGAKVSLTMRQPGLGAISWLKKKAK